MRRTAVFFALCMTTGAGCVEKWMLPGAIVDGGSDMAMTGTGGAGKGGNAGVAGALGGGGRGGAGPGTGGGTPTGGSGRSMCDLMRIRYEEIAKADVVFAVGRNSSMATTFGTGTRMTAAQQSVRNVVMMRQNAVNFGYQDFPSTMSCVGNAGCCSNSQPVFPNQGTFNAIDQAMRRCDGQPAMVGCVSLSEARPIADVLRNAITPTPPRVPIFGPYDMIDRELILIVDGAPGCVAENAVQACDTAVLQVSELKKRHINTHVIPLGEQAEASDCLVRMALQAGTGTVAVPFTYLARDASQLTQSLNQIVNRAAASSCVITVLSPVPADNRQVDISINNQRIPYDASGQNGWNLVAGAQGKIELHGSWCEELQRDPDDLEIFNVVCPL